MKLTLAWHSDTSMRALFSNVGLTDKNSFYLIAVFHRSKKGGFDRQISRHECASILRKENTDYTFVIK